MVPAGIEQHHPEYARAVCDDRGKWWAWDKSQQAWYPVQVPQPLQLGEPKSIFDRVDERLKKIKVKEDPDTGMVTHIWTKDGWEAV